MDFNPSCLVNLRQILPDLDFFNVRNQTIWHSNISTEEKVEQILSYHFANKRICQSSVAQTFSITKDARCLHSLFPSVSLSHIHAQLSVFQDMPNRKEIVLRLIMQSREKTAGNPPATSETLKRTSPTPFIDTMSHHNNKIRKLADMQPSTSATITTANPFMPRPMHNQMLPSTSVIIRPPVFTHDLANQEGYYPLYHKAKPPASFTVTSAESTCANRPEPFIDNLSVVTNGYEVPDIMEHFDLPPIVDVHIPVAQNCTITSSSVTSPKPEPDYEGVSPEPALPPDVVATNEEKAPTVGSSSSEGKESLDSNQTEIYSPDLGTVEDAASTYAPATAGPTAVKMEKTQVDEERDGTMGPKMRSLIQDVMKLKGNEPSTTMLPSTSKPEQTAHTKEFDLVEYVREITNASADVIERHCRRFNMPLNVKPPAARMNQMIDHILSIVIDSDDSDVEENDATLDYDFAIAEEIIAEDSSSSDVKTVDDKEFNKPRENATTTVVEVDEGAAAASPKPVLDAKLVKHLCMMFSDACPKYVKDLCRNKTMNDQDLNDIITVILNADNNYPKRPAPLPEPELLPENQLEILKEFLPDADPDYLRMICDKYEGKSELLRSFLLEATERRAYPKMKDYQRRQQLSAQQKQYTTEFSVENFVKVIPDPVTFFADPARNIKLSNADSHYALIFMRNRFNKLPIRIIQSMFTKNGCNISKTISELEVALKQSNLMMRSTRKTIQMPNNVENIPLLQELAYYSHKDEINAYVKQQEEKERTEREEAKNQGLLITCTCCYDDEVLPRDIYRCERECQFCKNCIVKSSEVRFGEGKLDFPCLMSCEGFFTLQTLQAVLSPKLFSKIAQKKALEEIKSAGIEELEVCPFCDFATIPADGYTIFTCMNPECMKESCRMCKEPSHVPLRCEEIEKDEDVKARTYLENKMTEALLKKCYKCGIKFFKEEGCNKMTCSCGAQMCYVCGQPVDNYKHFNGNGGDRYDLCPLYSDTNVLNKENVLKGVEEAKSTMGNIKLKFDPTVDVDKHYQERSRMFPQQHLLAREGPVPHPLRHLAEMMEQRQQLVQYRVNMNPRF